MLEVENIYKTYGKIKALDGLSFRIEPGKVFGLLGPNGSGKTTTIRIILSIIHADSGDVNMNFKSTGYLPEERGLYPDSKIDELIYLVGGLRGMTREKIKEGMNFWLERLELSDRKENKVNELSKGLKQRLHLLLSVLHNPDFLILDEPFTGLDPIAIKGLRELIKEMKERGKTILLSTHWMEQAEKLCNSICLIKEGRAIYSGGLAELKKRHHTDEYYIETEGDFNPDNFEIIDEFKKKDRGFIIKTNNPEEVIKELIESKRLLEFHSREPSLEEIFISELEK